MWTTTVCTLYTGSTKGMRLSHPLGLWLDTHDQAHFWNWRMLNPNNLVYRLSLTAPTCTALPTLTRRTFIKFSLTVPTELPFLGPPITLTDPMLGYICLPFPTIHAEMPLAYKAATHFKTLQQQFCSSIPPWKCVLFGSLWKAYSTRPTTSASLQTCPY